MDSNHSIIELCTKCKWQRKFMLDAPACGRCSSVLIPIYAPLAPVVKKLAACGFNMAGAGVYWHVAYDNGVISASSYKLRIELRNVIPPHMFIGLTECYEHFEYITRSVGDEPSDILFRMAAGSPIQDAVMACILYSCSIPDVHRVVEIESAAIKTLNSWAKRLNPEAYRAVLTLLGMSY